MFDKPLFQAKEKVLLTKTLKKKHNSIISNYRMEKKLLPIKA